MIRKTYRIELKNEEREFLQQLMDESTNDNISRIKAEVLLLADKSNDRPGLMVKDIATKLNIAQSTVRRTRYAYSENGIEFLRPNNKTTEEPMESLPPKVKGSKEVWKEKEMDIPGCKPSDRARYRVILSKEERELLDDILRRGKHSIRKIARINILLNADQGSFGPGMENKDIAETVKVSTRTVERVKKLFVGAGVEGAINFKHHNAGRNRKLDGRGEAHLTALACSTPPEGYARWTLRLLQEKLVELEIVDEISHVSVGTALKKTNLNLGKKKNG